MTRISIIVAASEDQAIGKNGDLLWRMPADMKHFKTLTTGHTIIMGRKTFDSLPKGALPNRTNIVLTRNPEATFANCIVCSNLQQALDHCAGEDEVFIIGGSQIYEQAMKLADRIYLTRVDASFPDADARFPMIEPTEWQVTDEASFPADEKNPYAYHFITYDRLS